jgi:16S rRNA (cytidine1402-2'-O)-methyltransferase
MPDRGGRLYLVATPIGNLEDITLRALRVLAEAEVIAAEDTRVTRRLLTRHGIANRIVSYHEHNAERRGPYLLRLLAEGRDVAVVSEAGMPGISDPGQRLVAAAVAQRHQIVPIPGPSAVIAALAGSGLAAREFTYLGFLPRSSRERRAILASAGSQPRALVCFESPHRLLAALADLDAVLGDRQLVVARELTKRFEEFVRGTPAEVRARFAERRPRGEVTIVVAPPPAEARRPSRATGEEKPGDMEAALARARSLIAAGSRKADAAREAAGEYGVARRDLYRRLLQDEP